MSCPQHSFTRSRKSHSGDAPYARRDDWWKNPDSEAEEEEGSSRQYITKRGNYTLFKKSGSWTMVMIASGLQKSAKKIEMQVRAAKLEKDFNKFLTQWKEETSFHSSLGEIFTNEAYQRIIKMGQDALPLILSELQMKPGHWFYALEEIAGRDIAADAGAKSFADARSAWLKWGRKNYYI